MKWTAQLKSASMRRAGIGCGLLLLAGALAPVIRADDATTRPATAPSQEAVSAPAAASLAGPLILPPINSTPQEWDDLMQFLQTNSPNRFDALRMVGNIPASVPLKQNMLRQYRRYKLVEEQFPDVAKLMLQQFKLEDDVFGLTQQARGMAVRNANQQIRPLIHDKEQEIVDLQFKQEQLRINRLQMTLNEEQRRLSQLQANMEQTVDNATNNAMPPRMRGGRGNANPQNQNPNIPASNPQGAAGEDDSSKSTDATPTNPVDPMSPGGSVRIENGGQ